MPCVPCGSAALPPSPHACSPVVPDCQVLILPLPAWARRRHRRASHAVSPQDLPSLPQSLFLLRPHLQGAVNASTCNFEILIRNQSSLALPTSRLVGVCGR